MSSLVLIEVTESTLPFLAGWLAGAADKRFNTGTNWTIRVYMDMEAGKLSLEYLHRLEKSIAERWPEGETPPSISAALSRRAK